MQHPNFSPAQRRLVILILGALNTVSPFSIDMYLAAFPAIGKALNVTSDAVSLSVSSYFVGLALGQVIYGPLLDRFGRKMPIYAGLALYILASIGCASSSALWVLILCRFLQAFGGCAAMVAGTAMVRDFFPVENGAKVFSLMMLVLGVSPLLAPTVGSFVAATLGWRVIFGLLAGFAVICILAVKFLLPEGHQPDAGITLKPGPIFRTYKEVLREPQFCTYALAGAFSFSGLFCYVAGSPGIFMEGFHLGPRAYGAVFAILAVGFIGASQVNVFIGKRMTGKALFRVALIVQAIFAIAFLIAEVTMTPGVVMTMICLFGCIASIGIIYPNAASLALAPFERNAGSAAALLGFLQMGIGAAISSGVGMLNISGALPVAALLTAGTSVAIVILLIGGRRIGHLIESEAEASVAAH